MRNLRAILDSLTACDRERIMYAFENGLEEHVCYAKGRYIAVNMISEPPFMIPDFKHGVWSLGKLETVKL